MNQELQTMAEEIANDEKGQSDITPEIHEATPEQIEEAANKLDGTAQKFIFQLIKKKDGSRSDPFTATFPQLLDIFDTTEEAIISSEDYVLLVCVIEGENTRIPKTPLISVQDLIATSTGKPTPDQVEAVNNSIEEQSNG